MSQLHFHPNETTPWRKLYSNNVLKVTRLILAVNYIEVDAVSVALLYLFLDFWFLVVVLVLSAYKSRAPTTLKGFIGDAFEGAGLTYDDSGQ